MGSPEKKGTDDDLSSALENIFTNALANRKKKFFISRLCVSSEEIGLIFVLSGLNGLLFLRIQHQN